MEKKLVLLDTSIFIDFFRKTDKANSQLIKLVRDNSIYCILVVTEFEIYTGTSPSQPHYWEEFLFRTEVLPFDKEVSLVAVAITKMLKQTTSLLEWRIFL